MDFERVQTAMPKYKLRVLQREWRAALWDGPYHAVTYNTLYYTSVSFD